jgi:exodeoxyribonuclease VII large subunit
VLKRRFPVAHVVIAPTLVQGDEAPARIVAAIEALNARSDIDVMIIARGGGSLEDLWAFNDERVARAIYASRIPVISGVGHETDWTICDWVADVRAPTPSAAAEIAVPDQDELRQQIEQHGVALQQATVELLSRLRADTEHSRTALRRFSPRTMVDRLRMSLQMLEQRLTSQKKHHLELLRGLLSGSMARLRALSPQATLERGYAVVSQQDTGHIITSVSQAQPGSTIDVQVKDGHFGAEVQQTTSAHRAHTRRSHAPAK